MTLSEKIEKNITQRVIRFTLVLGILLFIIASSNNIYVLGASNGKWMLINTTINPNNQPTEFYGGGLTPDWLPDKMHLGREVIFTVSETSMSTKDHKVLRDRLYFDFTLTANFDKPPANLIPGETVQLSATVSGSGSGSDTSDIPAWAGHGGGMSLQFQYRAEGVKLDGWDQVLAISGTADGLSEMGTNTGSFVVPELSEDGEIIVSAFLWNVGACLVEWVYQCEVTEPEYGVIEKDGKLYLNSPPDGTLEISMEDLPEWARQQIVTVGDMTLCVGPPSAIAEGDNSILLDGKPVARVGDLTTHGGTVLDGSERMFVNGVPAAFHGGFHVCPMVNPGPVPHIGGRIITLRGGKLPTTLTPRLKEEVSRGSTVLEVNGEGIEIGDAVIIGSEVELTEIARVIDKGSLILDRPLKNSYPAGTLVTRVPDEYSNLVLPPTEEELSITVVEPDPEPEPPEESANVGIPGFPVYSLILGIVCVFLIRKLSQ